MSTPSSIVAKTLTVDNLRKVCAITHQYCKSKGIYRSFAIGMAEAALKDAINNSDQIIIDISNELGLPNNPEVAKTILKFCVDWQIQKLNEKVKSKKGVAEEAKLTKETDEAEKSKKFSAALLFHFKKTSVLPGNVSISQIEELVKNRSLFNQQEELFINGNNVAQSAGNYTYRKVKNRCRCECAIL